MTVALLRARMLPVVVATLLAASDLFAQDWTFGANVGAGQGGFSGAPEFKWSHLAPSGSVFLTQPFARGFWLQPELGYSRKIGVSNTPISKLTLAADYLEVPLLFQYRWRGVAPVSPFVQLGPAVAVRLRCTLELVGSGVRTKDDCDVVRGEASQKVDATIVGGIGVAMIVAGTRLTLEGRANTGLVSSAAPVDASNPRSFGWSVLFGASRVLRGAGTPPVSIPRSPAPGMPSAPAGPQLPPIAATTIIEPGVDRPPNPERASMELLDELGSTRFVSVQATDADARALLLAVARESGIDLVVDSTVRARVSVALSDVSAADAIRAIMESAGLAIFTPTRANTAIVFYQLPVNIDNASAATIAARFGVTETLANFIVESRPRPPKTP